MSSKQALNIKSYGINSLIHLKKFSCCSWNFHEGGRLLLELNRVLRPGGHFIWSATPVYQKLQEDVEIWEGICGLKTSPFQLNTNEIITLRQHI